MSNHQLIVLGMGKRSHTVMCRPLTDERIAFGDSHQPSEDLREEMIRLESLNKEIIENYGKMRKGQPNRNTSGSRPVR